MRRRLAAGATLGAAAQISAAGLLLTSAWLIVRAAEHPPVMYLMVAIVSVRFFGIGRAVFRYGERLLIHDVALDRMTDDRVRVYQDLDRAAPGGLSRQRRGDIVSRVVDDVATAQDRLLRIQLPWLYASTTTIAVVVLLAFVSPTAAAVVGAHAILCGVTARLAVSRLARVDSTDAATSRGRLAAETSMLATTSRDIVAYGAADVLNRDICDSIAHQAVDQRRTAWLDGLGSAWVLLSTGAATAIIATTVSSTPAVMAGVLLLAPLALLEPLLSVVDAERLRPTIEESQRRLDQLSALRSPVVEPAHGLPLPGSPALSVRELVVGWDRPLIAPMSFEVHPGRVLGVRGPSGVGKTTVAQTLVRLVEPMSGSLTMGGVDYSDLESRAVRERVGLASQDDVIFDTSIRENMRVASPHATDEEIWSALERAGLAAFVRELPHGLDTVLGEGGRLFSGGERQRLSIARLLLAQCQILVLDEPTEHLDQPTAEQILRDLLELRTTHGIVLISHSEQVLSLCDDVVDVCRASSAMVTTPVPGPLEPAHV